MTLRSARRAARESYHRMAHLDTYAGLPDHSPEDCQAGLDIAGNRLDAMMGAIWPIVRRFAIQEFARRHGRRVVQFTPREVSAVHGALILQLSRLEAAPSLDRAQLQTLGALRRALAKLDELDA